MKALFLKRIFAVITVALLLAGLMAFPALADEPDSTEDVPIEPADPYVVFYAEQMKERMQSASPVTAYSFGESDGKTVLELGLSTNGNDPYVAFDLDGDYNTEVYQYVTVFVKSETLTGSDFFTLYYATEGTENKFVGGARAGTKYNVINGWQALTFDMTESEKWTGNLDKVRYDFFEGREEYTTADKCQLYALVLSQSVEDIYNFSFDVFCELYTPEQVISDFTEEDLTSIAKSPLKTEASVKDGNWRLYAPETVGDPSVMFDYQSLTKARGINALTTDDFRYTVFRYRTSMNIMSPSMELFILTGGADDLWDMSRVEGKPICHSGDAKYQNSRTWRGVMVDLAEDDGLEENTGLKYGWQGRGEFNGLRIDWCNSGTANSYMEISDMLLFADENAARGFTEALCSLTIPLPIVADEDETYETEHVVMPWETESETEPETETETLPEFSEDTIPEFPEDTEVVETETKESTATESEAVETEETDTLEEESKDNNVETEGSQGGDVGEFPGIDIEGSDEEEVDTGSQVPFYIACVALTGLSVASIVTVVVIRIKSK